MKVLDPTNSVRGRVNFVDVNNVFVGYETDSDCCEDADWYFSTAERNDVPKRLNQDGSDLEDYVFDTSYIKNVDSNDVDEGGMVRFRLYVPSTGDEVFLTLYNIHNGYYGHGFEMKIGKETKIEGTL